MSDQLQGLLFAIGALWACAALAGLIIFATGLRIYLASAADRRAAKRARIDVLEHRYRERLVARSGRPAVVLHIDQRRAAQ